MYEQILLIMSLLVVAFLYASVGHGGASGYLAVMAIFGVATIHMKSSALILNVFVSAIAFYQFYSSGHLKWKLFLTIALLSVPAAYLGARIPLSEEVYKRILGVCLLLPIARFSGILGRFEGEIMPYQPVVAVLIGAGIGLLSGMIGIGGGILLSPILILLHWTNQKEAAAISAPFILINSLAGIAALAGNAQHFNPMVFPWVFVAVIGGLMGGFVGSRLYSGETLNKVLALVLLIASIKLLLG